MNQTTHTLALPGHVLSDLSIQSAGRRARDASDLSDFASLDIKANSRGMALNLFSEIRQRMTCLFFIYRTIRYDHFTIP